MKKNIYLILLIFAVIGIIDAGYLTYEHYAHLIPPCSTNILFVDCGRVLQSKYAVMFDVPLALLGLIHYSLLTLVIILIVVTENKIIKYFSILEMIGGAIFSLYLMYLQLIVIKSICLYCTFSALISFTLFFLVLIVFKKERKELAVYLFSLKYRFIIKPILFLIDPEIIHETMLTIGKILGLIPFLKKIIEFLIKYEDSSLKQKIERINFQNPVGLAAGFDYEAKLSQILPSLGFGFETIGTITNQAYEGNHKPRLGRLPKSRSLMVNKGFKNPGAKEIIKRLRNKKFDIPIGISVGQTNSMEIKNQKRAIKDIISSFIKLQASNIKYSYYELNISCPNLYGDVTFYPPKNLEELLTAVDKLKIKKPIFIKMPIDKSDKETLEMLEVISKFNIQGVILGNLQKNRKDKLLYPDEVKKFTVGNFSGKPTFKRSNELIRLAYKYFGKRFVIIGCGGVFNSDDAYKKIKLGASLVQLITGMIYEGPQLIAQINLELIDKLKTDGFRNIKEAVGVEVK